MSDFAAPWTVAILLGPSDSPGRSTGIGCHALLQGIFLTQGSNLSLMSPVLAGGFFTTTAIWEAATSWPQSKQTAELET